MTELRTDDIVRKLKEFGYTEAARVVQEQNLDGHTVNELVRIEERGDIKGGVADMQLTENLQVAKFIGWFKKMKKHERQVDDDGDNFPASKRAKRWPPSAAADAAPHAPKAPAPTSQHGNSTVQPASLAMAAATQSTLMPPEIQMADGHDGRGAARGKQQAASRACATTVDEPHSPLTKPDLFALHDDRSDVSHRNEARPPTEIEPHSPLMQQGARNQQPPQVKQQQQTTQPRISPDVLKRQPSAFQDGSSPSAVSAVPGVTGSPLKSATGQPNSPRIAEPAFMSFSPSSSFSKPAAAVAAAHSALPRAAAAAASINDGNSQSGRDVSVALIGSTGNRPRFVLKVTKPHQDNDGNRELRLPLPAPEVDAEIAQLTSCTSELPAVYDGSIIADTTQAAAVPLVSMNVASLSVRKTPPDFFEQTNRPALDQLQRLIESGESVVVRVAKPDDLKQLSKLNEEFHVQTHRHDPSDKDTRKLWSTAKIGVDESIEDDIKDGSIICVAQAKEIYGFLLSKDIPASTDCHISTVFVGQRFRSQGHSKLLLAQAVLNAELRGKARTMYLQVAHDNDKAKHLYDTFGFKETAQHQIPNIGKDIVMSVPIRTALEKATERMKQKVDKIACGSRSSPRHIASTQKSAANRTDASTWGTGRTNIKWTDSEAEKLRRLVEQHGTDWELIATELETGRSASAVQKRYTELMKSEVDNRVFLVDKILGEGVDKHGQPAYRACYIDCSRTFHICCSLTYSFA